MWFAVLHYVYILRSSRDGKRYLGCTRNLADRLRRHNQGLVKATKPRAPWELIHVEEYPGAAEAFAREKSLKSWAGRIELGRILGSQGRGSTTKAG